MAYWHAETEPGAAQHLDREECDLIAITTHSDRVSALLECAWETAVELRSQPGVLDVAPAQDGTYVDDLTTNAYLIRDNGTRCEPLAH